jgi:D-glycero-D-manno-heptose 1,7-bisphosphate phosphatase
MALIILDRDGVINEDSDNYIRSLAEWHPIPGSIEAIAQLCESGHQVAIATNQSGLGRGYFDLDDLEAIHNQLCELVERQGGAIAGIFYCPHTPEDDCNCRKPRTGLLDAIEAELQQPVAGAFFVGDSMKDLEAATAAKALPILVTTGKGAKTRAQLISGEGNLPDASSVPVMPDLAAATRYILSLEA